ncbi:MAG: amino acid adenylation domain-containing protein, partial [Verrucomicrobiae bacterium]|nr:amino acid adenylation domain-containing protein [Verrucomicrobiae bacterium]
FEDWSRIPAKKRTTKLKRFLKEDLQKGFSLRGPLCRIQCLRFNARHTEWIITSHHVLFDGRSRRILLKEFLMALQAKNEKSSPALPPPATFSDHLIWLKDQKWNQERVFWEEKLKSLEEPTPIEISHGYLTTRTGLGTQRTVLFDKKQSTRIHDWSSRTGFSLNTLIQAAWGIFLSRTSGKNTVVFAAPRACRKTSVPDADKMVGLLMNTVPVVVNGMEEESIQTYLQKVQSYWRDLREFEHTPYQVIHETIRIAPNNPLYTSYLGFENKSIGEWSREESLPEIQGKLTGFTEIPISLQVTGGSQIEMEIIYDHSRFSSDGIRRLGDSFRAIVKALMGKPETKVRTIDLVSTTEKKRILKLGTGPRPVLPGRHVHRVFESVAEKHGNTAALKYLEEEISYKELDEQTNQLARFLLRDGLNNGDTIGLYFNRSLEAIISQLAVLKAGGVFVPLNPVQPKERLDWMLKNSGLKIVLTHSSLEKQIRRKYLNTICTDTDQLQIRRFAKTPPNIKIPDNPAAYIMYTSGSTGRPKGVVVPQAGVIRLVRKAGYVKLGPSTRMLQLTALTFDLSVFEIWGALLNGGTCVLYPGAEAEYTRLQKLIRNEAINTMLLSASVFNSIMDTSPDILRGVQQLVIGAEALSPRHVHKALKLLPDLQIINGYGPTEATALTNCHRVNKNQRPDRSVPIGRPINHATSYILDPCQQLLPPGVPGELYVGGIGLASGYKDDSGKTEEKFVPNPLKTAGDPILYRTGDRAFLHEDGDFDYIERFDDQLKIRGHRIEPGEIRAALLSHTDCKDAYVVPFKSPREETELAAFVILRPGSQAGHPEITEHLGRKLPPYMIPAQLQFIESLPLNTSGKVDRGALQERIWKQEGVSEKNQQGETPTEKHLSRIWRDVLKKIPATPEADFFESGGNSLLATSFVFRTQHELKVNLSFKEFEANSTIRSLARWVDSHRKKEPATAEKKSLVLRKIKFKQTTPLGLKWRTFCIPDIMNPESVKSLLITRAIILEGDLKPELLKLAMEEVIQNNERLRTCATVINGQPMEKVEERVVLNFPIKDLSAEYENKAMKIAMAIFRKESLANMNMRYAPQLRVQLLRLSKQKFFFSFVIQHAVADGYAVEMFYKQTSRVYNALVAGQPSPLKPSAYSYRQFEYLLEKWLKQGNEQRIKRFWRRELNGLKTIPYPFLVTHVPDDIGWNNLDHYRFTPEWKERILSFTQKQGITTYVFFATVVKLLIARYTDILDSYITAAVNGRTGNQQKDIFGDFACTILVRTRLDLDKSFMDHAEAETENLFVCLDHKYISANGIEAPHKKQVAHPHSLFGQLQVMEGVDTGDALELDGVKSSFLTRKKTGALTRLGFIVRESREALQITFAYAPMIFVPFGIERLKYNFQEFVRRILDNPKITLKQLPDLRQPDGYKKPLNNREKLNRILNPLNS